MKVKTCRICLAMGENMSFMGNPLKGYIEGIFKSNGFTQDLNESHYACFECKALLIKSYNFIQKSLRAQKIMYNILAKQKINLTALQSVDRVQLGLCSRFSYYRVDIDFYIEENEELKSTIGAEIDRKIDCNDMPEVKTENDVETYENCYMEDNITVEENITVTDPNTNAPSTHIQYKVNKPSYKLKSTKQKNYKRNQRKRGSKGELPAEIKPDNIILGCRQRKLKYEDTDGESKNPTNKKRKSFKKRNSEDEDYKPKEVSEESESPYDSFDDFGKRLKRPKENLLEYPRKCDHCSYTIEKANMHFKHYLFCHTPDEYPYLREAKFVCSICGLAKRTASTLKHHELTHGEKNFECDKCHMKFHNTDQLGRHKNRKHGTRQLICDYCNKVFRTKADIVLHLRTHTGEKPFKCHICGAGFAHLGNVRIHIRSRHQNNYNSGNKKKTSQKAKKKKTTTTEG